MNKEIQIAAFNLSCQLVTAAFAPFPWPIRQSRRLTINHAKSIIKFAEDSKFLNLFCDCTSNFEIGKLRRLLIIRTLHQLELYTKQK